MMHPSDETSEWELMRRHFSDERLRLYLTATNGDEDAAARLYQWNSRCSAAFWEALGYLEVSLRNALDARLMLRQRNQVQARHWVFDDARLAALRVQLQRRRPQAGRAYRGQFISYSQHVWSGSIYSFMKSRVRARFQPLL